MEWANDGLANDLAVIAQMRTQMWAVRIDDDGGAALRPEQDEIAVEIFERSDIARRQIIREADGEPAGGKGVERIARSK